jgi:hypothetical protein
MKVLRRGQARRIEDPRVGDGLGSVDRAIFYYISDRGVDLLVRHVAAQSHTYQLQA